MKNISLNTIKILNLTIFLLFGTNVIFPQNKENKSKQNILVESIKKNKIKDYKDWQEIKLKKLSFQAPAELKQKYGKCFDSRCYTFESEEIYLSIDISSAVGYPSSQKRYPSFSEKILVIDGEYGKIWHFEENKENDPDYKYKSGVVIKFPKHKDYKVGISIFSKKQEIKEIAEKIFKSIKFK